ncbi:hypothetical protein BGX31_001686 [Mortierella sp. GBA43]|nr:hypothetical protein BGX31_001686 [Mortierella sp. GBA43]
MARLSLILTASIAAAAIVVAGVPVPVATADDPCATLGQNKPGATYDIVAACYRNVPFSVDVARSTFRTVHTLFDDFYVFRDAALVSDLPAPFSSPPVDIIAKLNRIGDTNYPNDYSFHTDISKAIASLNDAHAVYIKWLQSLLQLSNTYSSALLVLSFLKSVRVFVDHHNRGYQDCEVTTIDGEPALEHLKAFADSIGGFSKDPGARLNQALATLMYDTVKGDFDLSSGEFAERAALPDKGYIDYELVCPSSASPINVRDPWRILDQYGFAFSDTSSFIRNICYPTPSTGSQVDDDAASPIINDGDSTWKKPGMVIEPKKSALQEFLRANGGPQAPATGPPAEPSDAIIVATGGGSLFYLLKSKPDVGVVVVFSHQVQESEIGVFMNAFDIFHRNGVTKILIDFQGNGGGVVEFASALVQLFFPNSPPFDTSLPSDLRVTESTLKLSNALFKSPRGGLYNAAQYFNWATKSPYQSNELFQQFHVINRGRDAYYTQMGTLAPAKSVNDPKLASYPWTNNPEKIVILTDGRCGSSCALSTHYFHDHYNVKAYAIGGFQSQALSMFSFAGGAVSNLDRILGNYNDAHLSTPMRPLPYQAVANLPLLEVYASDSSIPLEYDAARYPANVHIDFDPDNARRRDVLWKQVAGLAWV